MGIPTALSYPIMATPNASTNKDKKSTKTEKSEATKKETESSNTTNDPIIEAIEEDDEFEEFEPCNWGKKDEDADDAQQWQAFVMCAYRIIGMTTTLKMILQNIYEHN